MNGYTTPEADFTVLASSDEYACYHNLMATALERLIKWYRKAASSGNEEAATVAASMDRLLYTIKVLRWKYLHSNGDSLKVDLTDSGFPSSSEIFSMETDLATRSEKLITLDQPGNLKAQILEAMMKQGEEPEHLLRKLSERVYFEQLGKGKLFLSFNPGELKLMKETEKHRTYVFTWSCYDFSTSRPYIHIMTFDQSIDSDPLVEGSASYDQFMKVVKHEGSRAPGVFVIAANIDAAMEDIHPKLLKRICLGPLFSPFLITSHNYSEDELCVAVTERLLELKGDPEDVVFFFDDEILFSKRQKVESGVFRKERVREIFHIPEEDPACYKREASVVHRNVMLPHSLMQHIENKDGIEIPGFADCHKIVTTKKGEFRGI